MSGTFTDGPSLTLDHIRKAMELVKNLPPAPFLGSSAMFPKDHAWRFMQEGREYVLAHPDFWTNVPTSGLNNPLNPWSMPIHDIDSPLGERERDHIIAVLRKQTAILLGKPETPEQGA